MIRKIQILLVLFIISCSSFGAEENVVYGTYSLERIFKIKNLTFPRVLVYDQEGTLIEKSKWPSELKEIANNAGDAFCCVSDGESFSGEPPKDCKKIIYGENIESHFNGLVTSSTGEAIHLENLPKSKYLIVEYYAEWCTPCHGARKSLERFLKSESSEKYTALVIDFTKMQEKM